MTQNGTPGEVSPARREAIAALVAGATITAAATAAGVDRTALLRRLRANEVFVAARNGAKPEAADVIWGELRRLAPAAVRALRGILTAAAPATARLKAVDMALRAIGLTAEPIGPTDPAAVRADWERDPELERLDRILERVL